MSSKPYPRTTFISSSLPAAHSIAQNKSSATQGPLDFDIERWVQNKGSRQIHQEREPRGLPVFQPLVLTEHPGSTRGYRFPTRRVAVIHILVALVQFSSLHVCGGGLWLRASHARTSPRHTIDEADIDASKDAQIGKRKGKTCFGSWVANEKERTECFFCCDRSLQAALGRTLSLSAGDSLLSVLFRRGRFEWAENACPRSGT
jgi:hypothetical protein